MRRRTSQSPGLLPRWIAPKPRVSHHVVPTSATLSSIVGGRCNQLPSALAFGDPFPEKEGVPEGVTPGARAVQRVVDRVQLAPHPEAFHQSPGGLVVGEALGCDAPKAEVDETDVQ